MYGDSRALLSPDSTPIFPSNSKPKVEEIAKFGMNMNTQANSGLLRFRSAPSSLFANIPNGADKGSDSIEGFLNHRPSSPELASPNLIPQRFRDLNSQLPPHYPRHISGSENQLGEMDGSNRFGSSVGQAQMGSTLMRQNSSPAGLFSHLTAQNGFPTMRGVGNYRVGNGGDGDLSPSSSMLKGQMSFSSGLPSSLGMLSRISEIEGENVDDAKLGNGTGDAQFYASEYPFGSWNNSMQFTENFTHLKRELEDDGKLFARTQNGDLGNRVPMLSHHLSLPKTSAKMENLLQFQDSVPCKIRAKRGCATHPRSIAERVRRTRISERMRKLQELVPNMDKQTNTADMLDLAVDYIKNLQKQFKTLSDNQANCKCSSMQKSVPN